MSNLEVQPQTTGWVGRAQVRPNKPLKVGHFSLLAAFSSTAVALDVPQAFAGTLHFGYFLHEHEPLQITGGLQIFCRRVLGGLMFALLWLDKACLAFP